ncbi:MAG: leucine-rich repeat domain-containing protein [Candidatus Hydrogenedentota bacterium]
MNAKEAEEAYRRASDWYVDRRHVDALTLLVQIDRNYPGDPVIVGAIQMCRDALQVVNSQPPTSPTEVPPEVPGEVSDNFPDDEPFGDFDDEPLESPEANETVTSPDEESLAEPEQDPFDFPAEDPFESPDEDLVPASEDDPFDVAAKEADDSSEREAPASGSGESARPAQWRNRVILVGLVAATVAIGIAGANWMRNTDFRKASDEVPLQSPASTPEVKPTVTPEIPAEPSPEIEVLAIEEAVEPEEEMIVEEDVVEPEEAVIAQLETPHFEAPTPPAIPPIKVLRVSSLIRDLNLELAIREAINKPTGLLREEDFADLRTLSAYNQPIRTLEGIQHCVALEELNLNNTDLRDIELLSHLPQLRMVYLEDNWIADLSPLALCSRITHLSLSRTPTTDISWITQLTELQELHADYTGIDDVTPLYGMIDLYYASLSGNPLSEDQIADLIRNRPWCDPEHELTDQARDNMGFPLEYRNTYGTIDEAWSFKAEALVYEEPHRIELRWPTTDGGQDIFIGRNQGLEHHDRYQPVNTSENLFVGNLESSWTDVDIEPGLIYQYWLHQITESVEGPSGTTTDRYRDQVIISGIKIPLEENRGHAIVVIDEALHPSIADSLEGYYRDLAGDGWQVTGVITQATESVESVKAKLNEAYVPGEDHIFIFVGQVPVPYSGSSTYDGHAEHAGAHPTDAYYADLASSKPIWQDTKVNVTDAPILRHHNVPKDGKFDPDEVVSDYEAGWGRVYLAEMPSFGDEASLTNRYFEKLRRWKHGEMDIPARAIVDERFPGKIPFGRDGWNLTSIVGIENVYAGTWRTTRDHPFLFGYAGQESDYQHLGHAANIQDYVDHEYQVMFQGLHGDFFGDWHNPDNLLRAPLTQENYGIISTLASSPPWEYQLRYMPIGKHIGYGMRFTDVGIPGGSPNSSVRKYFMGDPAVRMDYPKPITAFETIRVDDNIEVRWEPSEEDAVLEQRLYRSAQKFSGYEHLTTLTPDATDFVDSAPGENQYYMLRAVVLTHSASGSYYNASIGIISEVASAE